MVKDSVKVLIVEDDDSVAESLQAVFSRFGFEVTVAKSPKEALLELEKNSFNYAFVDCMLPQQNGVDFVAEKVDLFRKKNTAVILMSGVLKDQAIIKYSLAKAKAIDFMVKPFNLDQILKIVRRDVAKAENTEPRKKLYSILQDESLTDREKKRILLLQDELEGPDLIALFCLCFDLKSTGFINFEWSDRSKASVALSEGLVTSVEMNDVETKIGGLLLQNQFVLPEDLNEMLSGPQGAGRLGQRLIQSNKLSPHAFDMVFLQQMKIRLSKILSRGPVRVSFTDADNSIQGVYLSTDDLFKELEFWIANHLSLDFLEKLFGFLKINHFVKSAHFRIDHPVFSTNLLREFPEFLSEFKWEARLDGLLAKGYDKEKCLKALYFLLVKGMICAFSDEVANEVSGVSQEASKKEELPKLPVLDSLPQKELKQESQGEKELADQSGSESNDLEMLKAIHEVEKLLLESKFDEAHASLEMILATDVRVPELSLFQAWDILGRIDSSINQLQSMKTVETHLAKVPKPYNESANYYYVKSLLLKKRQNYSEAKEFLVKAMHVNPQNMMIKRELMAVNAILQTQLSTKLKTDSASTPTAVGKRKS